MPYILPGARNSYVQWWARQLQIYALHQVYAHLNLPCWTWNRTTYPRYTYSKNPAYLARIPMVSHTTILPDGEEVTWAWKSMHSPNWRRKNDVFREGYAKGVKAKKGRKADSFNREEKTKDYRRKENGNWYGSRKQFSMNSADRADRRLTKRLIKRERYDEIPTLREPIDWWDFS